MSTPYGAQQLKPIHAAKRLGVYLPATPPDFQKYPTSRADLDQMERQPPEWLADLRRNGPHPRPVVAGRLGISIAGLARGGVTEALTTQEINDLRDDPPAWLLRERETFARVRAEEERLAAERHQA